MVNTQQKSKRLLLALITTLLISLAGCSSDSGTGATGNALPQPSVDCGGSSCID